MKEYIKFIIKNSIELDNEFLENQIKMDENIDKTEKIEILKEKTNLITWSNLFYTVGIISLIGISIYLYNNDWFTLGQHINKIGHLKELDNIGNIIYKLSAELSKSSTVQSWEIIHKVLKDLEKDSFDGLELITELEKLKKINILFPGQFSTNQDSFEKSLIKLINFLKEIL